jgi:circadian clock protein KaiC
MHSQDGTAETDVGLSSLMDAWILLLNREVNGEFNRELYLLKARGMSHSNQVREFIMSDDGIRLLTPYLGETGALTGSARKSEEAKARRAEVARRVEVQRLAEAIDTRRRKAKAEIEALQAEIEADEIELRRIEADEETYLSQALTDREDMEKSRRA